MGTYILRQGQTNFEFGGKNGNASSLFGAGGVGSPFVDDTAGVIFKEFRLDCGATSGDARGEYLRLYITGTGGGGESFRAFTTVSDVVAATAHGAHISLNFGTSGRVTGQGIAMRGTLH